MHITISEYVEIDHNDHSDHSDHNDHFIQGWQNPLSVLPSLSQSPCGQVKFCRGLLYNYHRDMCKIAFQINGQVSQNPICHPRFIQLNNDTIIQRDLPCFATILNCLI